jgi:hypothetical protein
MSTAYNVGKLLRTVSASVRRALGGFGRPSTQQAARPKLEARNGYGSRDTGEPRPRG